MAANLRRLAVLVSLGRIEVRSAPLGGWSPDFTLFRTDDGPFAVLVGPHRFERGMPHEGPILASVHGAQEAVRVNLRFRDVWQRGHDIQPAIARILARAEQRVPSANVATSSVFRSDSDSVDTAGGGR